jgi:hypothetical protein
VLLNTEAQFERKGAHKFYIPPTRRMEGNITFLNQGAFGAVPHRAGVALKGVYSKTIQLETEKHC